MKYDKTLMDRMISEDKQDPEMPKVRECPSCGNTYSRMSNYNSGKTHWERDYRCNACKLHVVTWLRRDLNLQPRKAEIYRLAVGIGWES